LTSSPVPETSGQSVRTICDGHTVIYRALSGVASSLQLITRALFPAVGWRTGRG